MWGRVGAGQTCRSTPLARIYLGAFMEADVPRLIYGGRCAAARRCDPILAPYTQHPI